MPLKMDPLIWAIWTKFTDKRSFSSVDTIMYLKLWLVNKRLSTFRAPIFMTRAMWEANLSRKYCQIKWQHRQLRSMVGYVSSAQRISTRLALIPRHLVVNRQPHLQEINYHQEITIIIIIMVLFYLFIQYYAVLKEISIR